MNDSLPTQGQAAACAECGAVLDAPGEFHPASFCVMKRAGYDPWGEFRWAAERLGIDWLPERPPRVRDLPLREPHDS